MRCRFCGNRGHNRNSCPTAAKVAEEAKAKIANGANRWDLDWDERFAHSIAEKKEARKIAGPSATPRKCSYCGNTGHNRSKCEDLKNDKASIFAIEKKYRNSFVNWMNTSGLGMGAIIQRTTVHGAYHHSIMVNGFNHKSLSFLNIRGSEPITAVHLDREGWVGDHTICNIPQGVNDTFNYVFKITAPSPIPFELPSDWTSDENIQTFVNLLFDEKGTRRDRWNRDNANKGIFFETRPNISQYTKTVDRLYNGE